MHTGISSARDHHTVRRPQNQFKGILNDPLHGNQVRLGSPPAKRENRRRHNQIRTRCVVVKGCSSRFSKAVALCIGVPFSGKGRLKNTNRLLYSECARTVSSLSMRYTNPPPTAVDGGLTYFRLSLNQLGSRITRKPSVLLRHLRGRNLQPLPTQRSRTRFQPWCWSTSGNRARGTSWNRRYP